MSMLTMLLKGASATEFQRQTQHFKVIDNNPSIQFHPRIQEVAARYYQQHAIVPVSYIQGYGWMPATSAVSHKFVSLGSRERPWIETSTKGVVLA